MSGLQASSLSLNLLEKHENEVLASLEFHGLSIKFSMILLLPPCPYLKGSETASTWWLQTEQRKPQKRPPCLPAPATELTSAPGTHT